MTDSCNHLVRALLWEEVKIAYRKFARESLPVSEKLARECLSLPMWSQMEIETLERICRVIEEIQLKSG